MKKSSKDLEKPVKHFLPEFKGEWVSKPKEKDQIFGSFSKTIASLPRLSEEEEKQLGELIQKTKDKDAQKRLVLHNMRLALKMAHQYKRLWTNLMDLVQEASAGLAIAARKWDPHMGTRFGTYASYWIKAQLTKFLMTNSRLIHTANTRAGRKIYQRLPEIRRKLLLEGKTPSAELIAKEVGEDAKEVGLILARLEGKESSLATPMDDNGGSTLQDSIAILQQNPEERLAENETQKLLSDIISGFEKTLKDERDLEIWQKHLISSEPISLVDLGKKYGVSKQRMGQVAVRIKRSFRRYIIERLGPDTQLSWLFRED